MKVLELENVTFENCFGKNRTTAKVDALINDNREYIKEYGSVLDYIWNDITENDREIYGWLKEDAAKLYEDLDSAEAAQISDLLYDFLNENYNYELDKELEITECTVTSENGMFSVEVEFNRNITQSDWAEIRNEVYGRVYEEMPERFKGTTDEDGFRFYEEIEDRKNEMKDEWKMTEPSFMYESDTISLEIDCVETFEDDEETDEDGE